MAKQIRPCVRYDVCPPLLPLAAQWGLAHFVEELYFKKHFAGLKFNADAFHSLDRELSPARLARLLHDETDLVEAVIQKAGELLHTASGCEGGAWLISETTLNAL